ncbi:gamma-glutamylcyclotransferase [Alphaproteobacteria bacterium]|jgi:glutathione-specific gamma-glutamylcyclotransferase|nr:gamma-glutamylcyclotransferase [Alphaproteobacteria bacterium]
MSTTKKINDGSIKLTRENITQGRLGEKIKSISGSDKVLTNDELIIERRKIIPDSGIGEDIYIFAYGSLLWNPTVEYEGQFLAKIFGFHRSFCMKTNLGRGSFKNPGLMLGLDQGGSCRGLAFKLKSSDAIKNIDILFQREMVTGAYIPKLLKTKLANEKTVLSLAFTVDKKHKNFFEQKDFKVKAKMIAKANGFLGSCTEYLNNTLHSLSELNIIDTEMRSIARYLEE